MTDWDDFRLYLALYRTGSLRAAAQQLDINHSTVSRRLTRLNKVYGVPLFEKSPLGYKASAAGESVLNSALAMEQTFQEASRVLKSRDDAISGEVKLSLPEAIARYLIFDELLAFQQTYPNIQLSIDASYAFADLDQMEADVVIRGCDTPPEHLVGKRIGKMNLGIYGNQEFVDQEPGNQNLVNQNIKEKVKWALAEKKQTEQDWFLNSGYADVPVGWFIDNFHLRFQAVIQGKAIARAPCYIAEQESGLQRLPETQLFPLYDLWVLTHKDSIEKPRVRVLMDYLYQILMPKKGLLAG